MDVNKLYENLVKAKNENLPKGIEFAWCDVNGNNVRWTDLVDVVALLIDFPEPTLKEEEQNGSE